MNVETSIQSAKQTLMLFIWIKELMVGEIKLHMNETAYELEKDI